MEHKRRKKKTAKDTSQPTTQSAGVWYNINDSKPPFFKIINIKTKSGKILNDCARIPDLDDKDFYLRGEIEYNTPGDIVEWLIPIYEPPTPYVSDPLPKPKKNRR